MSVCLCVCDIMLMLKRVKKGPKEIAQERAQESA